MSVTCTRNPNCSIADTLNVFELGHAKTCNAMLQRKPKLVCAAFQSSICVAIIPMYTLHNCRFNMEDEKHNEKLIDLYLWSPCLWDTNQNCNPVAEQHNSTTHKSATQIDWLNCSLRRHTRETTAAPKSKVRATNKIKMEA